MLRNLLILTLCVVAINASGELTLLNVPSSLTFKGDAPLQSQYVGDVLYAALGNSVAGDVAWPGLTINNPFELPRQVVAVYVEGARLNSINDNAKSYVLQGSDSEESLSVLSAELQSANTPVCSLNFKNQKEATALYEHLFEEKLVLPSTESKIDRNAAFIENIASNWNKLKNCEFLLIRTVANDAESNKEIGAAISKLNAAIQKSSDKNALVVAIANKAARAKRAVVAANPTNNPYNLAEIYSTDYPAIFNIILWFMIAFGLILLAVCYAIATMDPGRDSIIYRMTSTRMKKDN